MEPCFLDAEFLQERVMAIGSVCASMGNLSVIHKRADISVRDTYSTIVSYDEGNADFEGCGCPYPGDRRALDFYVGNATAFVGNLSWCVDPAAQSELLNPTTTGSIDWWHVWMESAVIADACLEFVLTCLLYSLIGWADPLAQCGGFYSVHHSSEPLNRYAQNQIHDLLLAQHAFWSCVVSAPATFLAFHAHRAIRLTRCSVLRTVGAVCLPEHSEPDRARPARPRRPA